MVTNETIALFMKEMNDAGVNWRINHHAGIHHGWTLPPGVWATEYDEKADRRATISMITTFAEVFPQFAIQPVECNAAGAKLGQWITPTFSRAGGSAGENDDTIFGRWDIVGAAAVGYVASLMLRR